MSNSKKTETRGYQPQPISKGYQPQRMQARDGYQPKPQQQSNQPVSQMKPPSTGSGIK